MEVSQTNWLKRDRPCPSTNSYCGRSLTRVSECETHLPSKLEVARCQQKVVNNSFCKFVWSQGETGSCSWFREDDGFPQVDRLHLTQKHSELRVADVWEAGVGNTICSCPHFHSYLGHH